jgi:hypothetical protein
MLIEGTLGSFWKVQLVRIHILPFSLKGKDANMASLPLLSCTQDLSRGERKS